MGRVSRKEIIQRVTDQVGARIYSIISDFQVDTTFRLDKSHLTHPTVLELVEAIKIGFATGVSPQDIEDAIILDTPNIGPAYLNNLATILKVLLSDFIRHKDTPDLYGIEINTCFAGIEVTLDHELMDTSIRGFINLLWSDLLVRMIPFPILEEDLATHGEHPVSAIDSDFDDSATDADINQPSRRNQLLMSKISGDELHAVLSDVMTSIPSAKWLIEKLGNHVVQIIEGDCILDFLEGDELDGVIVDYVDEHWADLTRLLVFLSKVFQKRSFDLDLYLQEEFCDYAFMGSIRQRVMWYDLAKATQQLLSPSLESSFKTLVASKLIEEVKTLLAEQQSREVEEWDAGEFDNEP